MMSPTDRQADAPARPDATAGADAQVPAEHEVPTAEIGAVIDQAVTEAETQGIAGKDVTPYLLARITELTEGRSLTANIALVRHNAALAAELAATLP